jgi:hypothetical protein
MQESTLTDREKAPFHPVADALARIRVRRFSVVEFLAVRVSLCSSEKVSDDRQHIATS